MTHASLMQMALYHSQYVAATVLAGALAAPGCMGRKPGGDAAGTTPSSVSVLDGNGRSTSQVKLASSEVCAECHSNSAGADAMRDDRGRSVGFFDLWRSSMMANAARDPLWRAAVSAEVAQFPSARSAIEAKCMRCHSPMSESGADLTRIDESSQAGWLARDGVSCAVCHQIESDNLGEERSFSGGFQLNDQARIYGPHPNPFAMPMQRFSGFTPEDAKHVQASALCATCHTLQTHALSVDGLEVGVLPEQAPYLEWKNSAFNDETKNAQGRSCQSCHMPHESADGITIKSALARNPGGMDFPRLSEREPYAQHIFVGGNTLIPAILRDNAAALDVSAPRAAFDATIQLATEQLQHNTADLNLTLELTTTELRLDVEVINLAGHKFPTGHPARRAWLEARIEDARGNTLLHSGAFDESGTLIDAKGRPLPSELVGGPFQVHRDEIDKSPEVYVLESVMLNDEDAPTYSLLRGSHYGKDNRLLPKGFSLSHPDIAWMRPVGVDGDDDFEAGSDSVGYRIDVSGAEPPLQISVKLLYQSLSPRYAAELFEYETPEVQRFQSLYEAADRTPIVVAHQEATIDAL